MNARTFVLLWLVSIVLSVVFIIGITLYPASHSANAIDLTKESIPQAPVVVIGSSLMRSAIAGIGSVDEGGILGDQRSHIRLAVSSIREEQALFLLNKVLAQNPEVIFLESNPFFFDFAHQTREKKADSVSLLFAATYLKESSQFIAKKINIILKRSSHLQSLTAEDRRLNDTFKIKPNDSKKYPLYLRTPRHLEKLQKLVNKAKAQGVQVIFIAPPRSQWAEQYIQAKKLEVHTQKLARQLNLQLFQPDTFWSNENFRDSAHMNAIGRERFLKELKAWWKTQQ